MRFHRLAAVTPEGTLGACSMPLCWTLPEATKLCESKRDGLGDHYSFDMDPIRWNGAAAAAAFLLLSGVVMVISSTDVHPEAIHAG